MKGAIVDGNHKVRGCDALFRERHAIRKKLPPEIRRLTHYHHSHAVHLPGRGTIEMETSSSSMLANVSRIAHVTCQSGEN
jgi:hypothetical protein